jgi:quercetin dioxygenase-like cupin family protein
MNDRTLHLTPNEFVVIRSQTPHALEVEGTWGPGGSPPPKHFHPAQEERFEVLEGTLRARVERQEHTLSAGQTLHVARGAVHQMWNEGPTPTRAIWITSPAGRTAQWFETLASAGKTGPLDYGVYLTEYRDVFRLAGPQPVVLGALRVLGAVGRLRNWVASGRLS